MGTTSTDKRWFWYIREGSTTGYLGIVDEDGSAPSAAYTIRYWGKKLPTEISTDGSAIPLSKELHWGFMKGCADEVIQAFGGKRNAEYVREYQETINAARRRRMERSDQPMYVDPLDLRDD